MFFDIVKNTLNSADAMQILNSVDKFYSESFDRLLIFTGIIITIVGVVTPIVLQVLQRKMYENEVLKLKSEIKDEYKAELDKLVDENKKELIKAKHYSRALTSLSMYGMTLNTKDT